MNKNNFNAKLEGSLTALDYAKTCIETIEIIEKRIARLNKKIDSKNYTDAEIEKMIEKMFFLTNKIMKKEDELKEQLEFVEGKYNIRTICTL
ncbi:MAG: hypothetical protein RR406_04815 [Bacilli bacterium]